MIHTRIQPGFIIGIRNRVTDMPVDTRRVIKKARTHAYGISKQFFKHNAADRGICALHGIVEIKQRLIPAP